MSNNNKYLVSGLDALNNPFNQTVVAEHSNLADLAADELADKYNLVVYNVTLIGRVVAKHTHIRNLPALIH